MKANTEFALVAFHGVNTAAEAFAAARDQAEPAERWPAQVGLVERHKDGHLVLRGEFAGHYLDVDEAMHLSEPGAERGWAIGGLIGLLLTPAGFAAGNVLGAMVGSQVGYPTETDADPKLLTERLRETVPAPGSAVILVADTQTVDALAMALGTGQRHVTRRTLSEKELAELNTALSDLG